MWKGSGKECMSKNKKSSPLGDELESYRIEGIPLWLNGKPSTPQEIVQACMIEEEGTYMRDYVQNERGKIERLEFDLVKLKIEK